MSLKDMFVSIVGAGNLGQAMANGLLKKGFKSFNMSRRNVDLLMPFSRKGIPVFANNSDAIHNSNIVVVCVEPNETLHVIKKMDLSRNPILISCAPGISIDVLRKHYPNSARAIPNTSILVNKGVTTINRDAPVQVEELFEMLGSVYRLNDDLLDAGTVLGACGVAFTMKYMRALTQAGITIGIDKDTSLAISRDLLEGSAAVVKGSHPEIEIDRVTTPKGCTIQGLHKMESQGFSSAVIEGVKSAHSKFLR